MPAISVELLDDLETRSLPPEVWSGLLAHMPTATPFMTGEWQRSWWRSFGRGQLLPILVRRGNEPILLAPLFADGGMVFFVGSGGSDYLDFVGPAADTATLTEILTLARELTHEFVGFRFYHVPEHSGTDKVLRVAAQRLDMECVEEGLQNAPALDVRADPDRAARTANKRSLVRHERYFSREGELTFRHLTESAAIEPLLEGFFEQHVERWRDTPYPSLFLDSAHRKFYRELTREAGACGWLRFTSIEWNGRPIACHFGFCYRGRFIWYKPSFAVDLAKRSPGEVLLRQLILETCREGAHTLDFGLGDEPFKQRFATHSQLVRDWGLYPVAPHQNQGATP